MFDHRTIRRSAEFERIRAIPRRAWTPAQMDECARYYTGKLRTPAGTWTLRPLQAVALHEIATVGGLLGPIRVGGGKTLLSLLAPRLVGAVRPVLLLPAALVDKTRREMGILMAHWAIPRNIQIQSYEMLGRENAANFFQIAHPDFIFADEAHRLKNARAGVTRRVARWMHEHPETRFAAVSGTLLKDDLRDFAHLAGWALKAWAPVPLEKGEISEWADCLAPPKNPMARMEPGPLLSLATPDDAREAMGDTHTLARLGFRRRLRETPGVVASGDEHVACSLLIRGETYDVNATTEANFRTLRTAWETPDGWALSQAVDVWRHARELALGFHYVWDPRPPREWIEARREWAALVREILSSSHTLDTELQVSREYGHTAEFRRWEAVRPTFQIQPRAIWHDPTALDLCAAWMRKGPGIVWVDHAFFGHELSRRTGVPYFGEQGQDVVRGTPIEQADPKGSIIASGRANSTGRNLQAWARNLFTSAPAGAPEWEQRLGRTHRDGQEADEVIADVLFGCREHFEALERALIAARANVQTMGHAQKLLLADIATPDEWAIREWARTSYRWRKSAGNGREGEG